MNEHKKEQVVMQPDNKEWYIPEENQILLEDKKWLSVKDLLDLEIGNMWLWENYLPKVGIAGLTGASDIGKSTILRQLAIEIIRRGNEFLGAGLNTRTGNVVYVCTEDGQVGTKLIMSKLLKAYDLTEEQCNNLIFLFEVEDLHKELNQKLKGPHVDLIVIDNWGDILDGSPSDFMTVRKNLKALKTIAEKYQCCVLLLHHSVKNSEKSAPDKNKLNGSQAIEAKMRSLIELRQGDFMDERLLTILKGNYVSADKKNESLVLKFDKETLSFSLKDKRGININPQERLAKFDKKLWLQRLKDMPGKEGIDRRISRFKLMFPNEAVPSKTWFVENKEDKEQMVEHP